MNRSRRSVAYGAPYTNKLLSARCPQRSGPFESRKRRDDPFLRKEGTPKAIEEIIIVRLLWSTTIVSTICECFRAAPCVSDAQQTVEEAD